MYSHVAAVMHHVSCVLLNIGLYFLVFFCYLGSICSMHVLCVSNPVLCCQIKWTIIMLCTARWDITVDWRRWSDNRRLLHHSSLKPVWSSRSVSSRRWWLGVLHDVGPDISTSHHHCVPQRSQDLLPLRRPTHHPPSAARPWDDRGNYNNIYTF